MFAGDQKHNFCAAIAIAVLTTVVVTDKIGAAQDLPSAVPLALPGFSSTWLLGLGFGGVSSFSASVVTTGVPGQVGNAANAGYSGERNSVEGQPVPSGQPRRVSLQQIQQQSANRLVSAAAHMSQLSVEAAKQHRLAVEADYFPKFGATFLNLHTTDFLGQFVEVRTFKGTVLEVPAQIVNQNQTFAALTFVQPITPLFEVRQAVQIARADERIARAKATAAVFKTARNAEIEETYFKLLIAQRQLTSAEWKLRNAESRQLYASASHDLIPAFGEDAVTINARKAVENGAATVRELTAALNREMGWPEDTGLDLAVPDPLVENISLQDVSDKPAAGNAALVEAEQTVLKARAASSISKMAYIPTVAAIGGYLFQNTLPAVNSNFGYGGVMASYTLFDFGKREHAVKEAHAQLEMAEMALQLTKTKLAADVQKSYLELEHSRQLSHLAQKMGSSTVSLLKVSSGSDSLEVWAACADLEVEMIEADFAHRHALNHLKALLGPER
jgi:outer membrane protein